MSTRKEPVKRRKHGDSNVRVIANSKAHLRRLSAQHSELIDSALESTMAVVATCKEYGSELTELDVKPTLALIATQIKSASDKQKSINERIEKMSPRAVSPMEETLTILEELTGESMAISSSVCDPLMDVMNDINKRIPDGAKLDLAPLDNLLSQLDDDTAANNPVAQIPETNRVMQ